MSFVEPALLERVVDGEGDPAQVQRLIAHCETQPEAYRAVALAFMERQRISAALREFVADDRALMGTPPMESLRREEVGERRWSAGWLAIAGVGLGLVVGATAVLSRSSTSTQFGPDSRNAGPWQDLTSNAALSSSGPDKGLETKDSSFVESMFPEQTREALRDAGFEWNESPHLYLINAGDGSRWAVPTHEVTLRYRER